MYPKSYVELSSSNIACIEEKIVNTNLLTNTEWIYVPVGYVPVEKPVRILGSCKTQNQKKGC